MPQQFTAFVVFMWDKYSFGGTSKHDWLLVLQDKCLLRVNVEPRTHSFNRAHLNYSTATDVVNIPFIVRSKKFRTLLFLVGLDDSPVNMCYKRNPSTV